MNHYGQYIITDNSLVEFMAEELSRKYRELAQAEERYSSLKAKVGELEKDLEAIAIGSGASKDELNNARDVWKKQVFKNITCIHQAHSPKTLQYMKSFASTLPPSNSDDSPMPRGNR